MNFHLIHLEAHLPEANIRRFFNILFGKNLFGDLQMTVTNGRIGAKGRKKHFLFEEETSLYKKLRQVLRKRLNAHKRLGCAYIITDTDVDSQTLEKLICTKSAGFKAQPVIDS
jgi:predicted DNA-binding WGR domain protein